MSEQDEKRKLAKEAIREVVREVLAEEGGGDGDEPPGKKKKKEKSAWDAFVDLVTGE